MDNFIQWLRQLRLDGIFELIVVVAASLLCITLHETCHGLAAYWLGDDTAKRQGRLSLNPLRHIDPVGLVMMALLRFGWAKPVQVDMRRFKNPKAGMALTALAGPVSNILLTFLGVFLLRFLEKLQIRSASIVYYYFVCFLYYISVLSAGLAVFNFFPIPPLDGSKVLFSLLPNRIYLTLMRYERFGMILLVVLLFSGVLDTPLYYLRGVLLDAANAVAGLI